MSDLISRQGMLNRLEEWNTDDPTDKALYNFAWNRIIEQPTIEPERKKGKWQITDAYPHNVYCSECHTRFAQTHWAVWEDGSLPRNFCPNCGADMRGDNDDQSK